MKSILTFIFIIAVVFGWGKNIYTLATDTDFQAPYGEEVFRVGGIFVFPVGAVLGYINLENKKEEDQKNNIGSVIAQKLVKYQKEFYPNYVEAGSVDSQASSIETYKDIESIDSEINSLKLIISELEDINDNSKIIESRLISEIIEEGILTKNEIDSSIETIEQLISEIGLEYTPENKIKILIESYQNDLEFAIFMKANFNKYTINSDGISASDSLFRKEFNESMTHNAKLSEQHAVLVKKHILKPAQLLGSSSSESIDFALFAVRYFMTLSS